MRLHGIGDLRADSVPDPEVSADGDVVIRVLAAGICGSDLHNFTTGQWIGRLPIIPGHEFCGEVVAAGAGVGGVAVGDLVVADSRVSCGSCPACRSFRPNICARIGYVGEVCDGGFAELAKLPEANVLRVPPGVRPEIAALAEPLAVALHAVRRLGAPVDRPVLVAGAGPVGGLAVLLLSQFGQRRLALLERNEGRARAVAGVTGATILEGSSAAISAWTGMAGVSFAIEATGSAAVLQVLVDVLQGGGRIAMVGLFRGAPSINANALVEKEIELVGCSAFRDEQREAVAMLPELAPRLARVLSAPVALDDVPAAYAELIAGRSPFLKTIIRP